MWSYKLKSIMILIILIGFVFLPLSFLNAEKVTLSFWTNDDPGYMEAHKKILAKWKIENPNIRVKWEAVPKIFDKALPALARGQNPDIYELHTGLAREFIEAGILTSVPEWVMSTEEIEEKIWSAPRVRSKYQGRHYAINHQFNADITHLKVNMKLAKEAGVSLSEDWPKNWHDVLTVAKKLTKFDAKGNMIQSGFAMGGHAQGRMWLQALVQLATKDSPYPPSKIVSGEVRPKGWFINEKAKRFNFHTPEAKRALQFIVSLVQKEKLWSLALPVRQTGFEQGTTAMEMGATYELGRLKSSFPDIYAHVKTFDMPPFFGDKPYKCDIPSGWAYMVPATSKHQEEAWRYVKFAIQPENLIIWAQNTGEPSAFKFMEEAEWLKSSEGLPYVPDYRALKWVVPMGLVIKNHHQFFTLTDTTVELAMRGKKSVEEALDYIEKKGNIYLSEWWGK